SGSRFERGSENAQRLPRIEHGFRLRIDILTDDGPRSAVVSIQEIIHQGISVLVGIPEQLGEHVGAKLGKLASHFAVALFEHGSHAIFDKELNVGFEYMKVGKGTYQMVELDGVVPYDYVAGDLSPVDHILFEVRSEERRVGRECRSRWRARN